MVDNLTVTSSTIGATSAAKNISGGNLNFSDAGNTISMGTATWTVTNGDFNYVNVETLNDDTSTVVMAGTGRAQRAPAGSGRC